MFPAELLQLVNQSLTTLDNQSTRLLQENEYAEHEDIFGFWIEGVLLVKYEMRNEQTPVKRVVTRLGDIIS